MRKTLLGEVESLPRVTEEFLLREPGSGTAAVVESRRKQGLPGRWWE